MTVRLLHGDVRAVLPTLPDDSVHCVVTSPPYWGLRSYLPEGHPDKHLEIGSEPTLQEWVDTMVAVFREVRRVLRPDGTLWLNLGDAYTGSRRGPDTGSTLQGSRENQAQSRAARAMTDSRRRDNVQIPRSDFGVPGLKPKDMMGQPWRVAFALQADGWWLRQEIIWSKSNPMPESARDRCTKSHEHVFLLSKSERYFYDFDAMQEPVGGGAHARRPMEYSGAKRPGFGHGYDEVPKPRYKTPDGWDTAPGAHGTIHRKGREKGKYADGASERMGREPGWRDGKIAEAGSGVKNNSSMDEALADVRDTRNPRSVWTIPTHPFKGAHFATFPPALAERCITAGCPEGGTVLDIFGGSGTVGMVADRQHKHAILIDLDERNKTMAEDRIRGDSSLFAQVET